MVASTESLQSAVESTGRRAGWAVALRGVVAVVFGVIALRSPNLAASAFVIVFAVYAFADGLFDFALAADLGRSGQRWGWYLFEGVASVGLGVIALAFPGVTLAAIVFLVAIRAIVLGIFELMGAFSGVLESRWLLGITGALSVVLGVLLLANPIRGGFALLWTIGVYAIVFGVMLFALGLRMLHEARHEPHLHRAATSAG